MLRPTAPYNPAFWSGEELLLKPAVLANRRSSWQDLKVVRSLFSGGVRDGDDGKIPAGLTMAQCYLWMKMSQRQHLNARKAVVVGISDDAMHQGAFSIFLAAFHVYMDSVVLDVEPEGTPPLEYRATGSGMEHLHWLWSMLDLNNPSSGTSKSVPMEQVYLVRDWFENFGPPIPKKRRTRDVAIELRPRLGLDFALPDLLGKGAPGPGYIVRLVTKWPPNIPCATRKASQFG